jgi:rRNA maturation RNase YbeY
MKTTRQARRSCDASSPLGESDALVAIPGCAGGGVPLPPTATRASQLLITNRQRTKKINARFLKQVVAELFVELEITEAELGIMLVGAKEMARVNWQFLQHEGSTDVITFDYGFGVPPSGGSSAKTNRRANRLKPELQTLHGELFICVDEAVTQAKEFGTSWQAEAVRYVVHGVLHLLGYDDLQPELRRTMKREENRLVRLLAKRFSFAQL